MNKTYPYAVWATQGGGLVRFLGGEYIFVEAPDCLGFNVGDRMPDEWGIISANEEAARMEEDWDTALYKYSLENLQEYLLEGVTLQDISSRNPDWCLAKLLLISSARMAELLGEDCFDDKANGSFGEYMVALHQGASKGNGEVPRLSELM